MAAPSSGSHIWFMWEIMDFLLELVCGVLETQNCWRFSLPFIGSVALAGLIDFMVSNEHLTLVISIPLVILGVVIGVLWERQS